MSLLTGFGSESPFVDMLLSRFKPRAADARQFALDHRVLLLSASNGTPLDVSLAGIPFEEQMMDRASPYAFTADFQIVTASAEDIVVLKAFASRAQDWLDIEGILAIRNDDLDWFQIETDLEPLAALKEEPEILERLNQLRGDARRQVE